jgi:hypothetical protein
MNSQGPKTATSERVRVIRCVDDPYAGLKGHAYIAARKLNLPVQRVHTSAHCQASIQPQVQV